MKSLTLSRYSDLPGRTGNGGKDKVVGQHPGRLVSWYNVAQKKRFQISRRMHKPVADIIRQLAEGVVCWSKDRKRAISI